MEIRTGNFKTFKVGVCRNCEDQVTPTPHKRGIKMLRQGMSVSIAELKDIIKHLEEESKEWYMRDLSIEAIEKIRWSIPIINKEPNCSDTWEIEPFEVNKNGNND